MATSMLQKNLPYLKQHFTLALGDSSVFVKFLCVALLVGYFLTFSETAVQFLAVIPGNVIPPNFWVWTYVTHGFLELHIWIVIIDIGVIVLYGKLLEPLWGAMEMMIFYFVISFCVAILSSMTYLFIYQVTRNPDYLFETVIHGLPGYLAGFSVAVKQVMPDHVLVNSPFGKLRNRHIPLYLLLLAILVRLVGGVAGPFPVMFGSGLLVSWIYLRFYQKHSNGNRGDMADSFAFASFFPTIMQAVINVFSNTLFNALVKVKICKKPQRRYNVGASTTITVSLPGTDPQDAERRRQVALKALDERLARVSDTGTTWPTMDEEPSSSPTSVASTPTTTDATPLLEVKTVKPGSEDTTDGSSAGGGAKGPASVAAKVVATPAAPLDKPTISDATDKKNGNVQEQKS